ncbi:GNAT family N-acetyltransferase [Parasphingopyxis lamellibrachiae]|uniref:Acetyltransferase (GNAT) family protein n=1 Tax=Parasphingopyxis lamellibrachiae TaxID=680125 RepID=A0A3D9FCY3_9SPHN|nr:GNAT family N-acetyltransferase [Parasphingopyxis lamellibrachiae]RED15674.1 acetyltransferase (GNAT) family protein [Parasphingopyxis lamellibrachiae]
MTVNVKLFDSLADVASDAGNALGRAQQPSLYNRIEWFERTARHCGAAGKTPLIARARCGNDAAWLFLYRTSQRHAEALASWYTLDFDIVRTGDNSALLASIAGKLKQFASITIAPLADPGPVEQAFGDAGWKVIRTVATENWKLRPPEDFETFWSARPGKLRSTVKRKGKKANLEIAIHNNFNEQAWEDYKAIYAQSWKPDEGSWDFMREFAEHEGEAGTLRLGVAYKEGEPVAAQLWHVENGHATIHKLAYTENSKSYSPGSILSEAMFRHVIERDAPAVIDYGTGSEPYKADWMDAPRPLYRLQLYNPRRPAAWLSLLRHKLSGLVGRSTSH